MLKVFLIGKQKDLVKAWEKELHQFPDVFCIEGDILDLAEGCIVSPANSYGYMDGGIDRYYVEFFGQKVQQELQIAIQIYCKKNREFQYLPVGASVLVETGHLKIPYMIAAPTMISPGPVGKENSFFAMSAVLNCAWANRDKIKNIYCPGLATGIGKVPHKLAANEMATAYRKWFRKIQQLSTL